MRLRLSMAEKAFPISQCRESCIDTALLCVLPLQRGSVGVRDHGVVLAILRESRTTCHSNGVMINAHGMRKGVCRPVEQIAPIKERRDKVWCNPVNQENFHHDIRVRDRTFVGKTLQGNLDERRLGCNDPIKRIERSGWIQEVDVIVRARRRHLPEFFGPPAKNPQLYTCVLEAAEC